MRGAIRVGISHATFNQHASQGPSGPLAAYVVAWYDCIVVARQLLWACLTGLHVLPSSVYCTHAPPSWYVICTSSPLCTLQVLGESDKPTIEKHIDNIVKESQRFDRVVVSREEALAMFQENKFKVRGHSSCRWCGAA